MKKPHKFATNQDEIIFRSDAMINICKRIIGLISSHSEAMKSDPRMKFDRHILNEIEKKIGPINDFVDELQFEISRISETISKIKES